MANTLLEELLDNFCRHHEQLLVIVGLLGVFLLLSLVGTLVITPGTSAHVVNTMNVVGLSAFLTIFVLLLLYCHRSERVYR